MPTPFSRTLRSLDADARRPRRLVWAAALFLLAWGGWFCLGRVTLYEASDAARMEAPAAAHPLAAEVRGRVAETYLILGHPCRAGDVLLVLDAEAEQLALAEAEARAGALRHRREALGREIDAERQALAAHRSATGPALDEARARVAEAEVRSRYADEGMEIADRLRPQGAIARLDWLAAKSDAETSRAAVQALRVGLTRTERERLTLERDRLAQLARLEKEAAELDGDLAAELAAVRRLGHEVARRVVRAPIDGRIAAVRDVRPGSVVEVAEALGSVVPEGGPRVVALFPARAVGRLRPGQAARLRLDGFPWTEYGSLAATVTEVGPEPSRAEVRVELTLAPADNARLPVEHGVTGSAEVAVEEVSPAGLVLRAAGEWLTRAPAAPPPAAGAP
ncbi:MAG TPA: HlyD family efflux transporter periplasmic adaptor subunit [Gemmataceae bacterium]|nr:HlyD family efflux transporter periplasmic adaptor subunit [Gemmataceae bacterium]